MDMWCLEDDDKTMWDRIITENRMRIIFLDKTKRKME